MRTRATIETGRGIGFLWCRLMHDAPMWPFRNSYQCRVCGRTHRVQWEAHGEQHVPRPTGNILPLAVNQ